MPYYSRGGEDDVDEFDEFDPTPYGGGYNLELTYGRPLEPSDETCYPSATPSDGDFDYARPDFSSGYAHLAYADEALETEYSSYLKPKPRPGRFEPAPAFGDYGRKPEYEQFESGHGRKPEFGRPGSEFESDFGRRPEFEQPPEEFGSGHGRRPAYEHSHQPDFGSGRRSEFEQPPPPEFGTGYRRRPEFEQPPPPEFESGHGRRPEYGEQESEFGSEYGRKPERI
uniref:Uncharacterized protein n=1 Tax=Gossypium raimondii TaxID=29730 RepID=A0A0D2QVA4_GOSRA|nr:hypothetical protein B456_001G240600 [Gossypium raimondii]